jgi:uncharacterized protein YcbK (DUF882 family)
MSRLLLAALAAGLFLLIQGSTAAPALASGESCLPSGLKSTLSRLRQEVGGVRIISTYRKGARISGSGKPSFHASCRAVDFTVAGGKTRQATRWLMANHSGGIGTYSRMGHIHIDNGPSIRWHH